VFVQEMDMSHNIMCTLTLSIAAMIFMNLLPSVVLKRKIFSYLCLGLCQ